MGSSATWRWCATLAGIVVLAVLVHCVGWTEIVDTAIGVGPWFGVLTAIDSAALAADSAAIWSFAGGNRSVAYSRAVLAQATGYAINQFTPGNTLGEPVKVALLASHAPRPNAMSAIVLYNLATVVAGIAIVVVGTSVLLFALDLPPRLAIAIGVATAVFVIVAGALVLFVRRRPCAIAIAVLARVRVIGVARSDAWRERTCAIDLQLAAFGSPATRQGLAFAVLSRVLHAAGTLVLLHAIGMPLGDPLVLAILSLGVVIGWVANLAPFGIGIADGGHYLLYAAFGAAPGFGLAYAMVERARAVAMSLVAIVIAAALARLGITRRCGVGVIADTFAQQVP